MKREEFCSQVITKIDAGFELIQGAFQYRSVLRGDIYYEWFPWWWKVVVDQEVETILLDGCR